MTEQETNQSVKQEVAVPDAHVSENPQAVVSEKNSDKELNFKKLRDANEDLKRQVEELRDNLSRNASSPKQEPVNDEFAEIERLSSDDILTKRQMEILAERRAKEIVEKVLVEKERQALPTKVKSKYSDFDAVVTKETIEEFEKNEPELAQACASSSNPYEATYKMLKLLNGNKLKNAIKQEQKVEEPKIPLSSSAFNKKNGLSSANLFGSMSKQDLYKEMMQHASKG